MANQEQNAGHQILTYAEAKAISPTIIGLLQEEPLSIDRLTRNYAHFLGENEVNYSQLLTACAKHGLIEPVKISPPVPPVDGFRLTTRVRTGLGKFTIKVAPKPLP